MVVFVSAAIIFGVAIYVLPTSLKELPEFGRDQDVRACEMTAGVACLVALLAVVLRLTSTKTRGRRKLVLLQIALGVVVWLVAAMLSFVRYSDGRFTLGEPVERHFNLELFGAGFVIVGKAMADAG
jgi:predicted Co/Zn/Cd cation transporter (cation efflux family)